MFSSLKSERSSWRVVNDPGCELAAPTKRLGGFFNQKTSEPLPS